MVTSLPVPSVTIPVRHVFQLPGIIRFAWHLIDVPSCGANAIISWARAADGHAKPAKPAKSAVSMSVNSDTSLQPNNADAGAISVAYAHL